MHWPAIARSYCEPAARTVSIATPAPSSRADNRRGQQQKRTNRHSEVPISRSLPFIDPLRPSLNSFGMAKAADGMCQRSENRLSQLTVARTEKRETRTWLLFHSLRWIGRPVGRVNKVVTGVSNRPV